MEDKRRVLVLAPHTDDGEFGCGGTLARFVAQGREVRYVAFSTAEDSVPDGFPQNVLETEVRNAVNVLGIPPERLRVGKYPVRKLGYHRQEVLEELVAIGRELKPDLVFLPSGDDLHQDHQVVHMEGLRAFKKTSATSCRGTRSPSTHGRSSTSSRRTSRRRSRRSPPTSRRPGRRTPPRTSSGAGPAPGAPRSASRTPSPST